MELLALDAEQIAMDFLMNDLEIPAEERDFFYHPLGPPHGQ